MEILTSEEKQAPLPSPVHALDSANIAEQHLFAHLTSFSSAISRLSNADADLFRTTFQQEPVCYARSWLYLLRSTRNDQGGFGYKFVGQDTSFGIGYRNNTLYVVHPIGSGRFTTTRDFVQELRTKMSCPIILKKIDQPLYEYLSSTHLFQSCASGSGLLEEEAFPEHVLPLSRLYSRDGGLSAQSLPFMRKVRRFENSSKMLQVQTGLSGIESRSGFRQLFGGSLEKYKSYLPIVREVLGRQSSNDHYKVCVYSDEDGMVHGLYLSERLEERKMGLYCAVSSKSSPGMTEWMDYDFFRWVYNEGIHTLYLGGSETEGVHRYVKKLLPLEPIYLMRPLVMSCDNDGVPATGS
jgi:hypothetical protein